MAGGRLLGGGGVHLLGIIQYVSVRSWPTPGKLVAFCIVNQSKKNLKHRILSDKSDFFFRHPTVLMLKKIGKTIK